MVLTTASGHDGERGIPAQALRLAVIVGSTREGRFGPLVTRWLLSELAARGGLELDVIDLGETRLPAQIPAGPDPDVAAFTQRLARADAFIVVTPEYNHSYPAALKHAIDLVDEELAGKPVAFVSYGGISGGLRAVEHLRGVFAELHAVTIRETVALARAGDQFDAEGRHRDPEVPAAAARRLLAQLTWWAEAAREAKARRPYPRRAA